MKVLYQVMKYLAWILNQPSYIVKCTVFNSLAPGKFKVNFIWVIFKLIFVVDGWGISCETALIWMSLDHTYDKSTLVQVMAWCRQATSHYLNQCWPRFLPPYGVTRPQWVNIIWVHLWAIQELPSTHTFSADSLNSINQIWVQLANDKDGLLQYCCDVHGYGINLLRPSNCDTIWRHKFGSTLAQVMACCLMVRSHYLNQCWLIISKVQWHPSECSFTSDNSAISHWN